MAKLQVLLSDDNEVIHDLDDERITIGRLPDNAIQIEDDSVSSHHAELVSEGGSYRLRDLDSTNGTFVNGEPVKELLLASGARVRIGRVDASFTNDEVRSDGAQPAPESPTKSAAAAASSARPAEFTSSSPVPRGGKEKDPVDMAMFGLAALGILTAAAAAYFVFTGVA